jgi:hypothetical protein
MSHSKRSEKLEELRQEIRLGADALSQGYFIEIDDAELDKYLEQLDDHLRPKSL